MTRADAEACLRAGAAVVDVRHAGAAAPAEAAPAAGLEPDPDDSPES